MNIQFKLATEDDVEAIIQLCNECFEENTALEYAAKVFRDTKDNPNDIYLVGIAEGRMVAHAKITIIQTIYEEMNTYAILNHVCVKPEYRRLGIATKMLDEITRLCQERGVKTMELWSKNVRIPVHACYKSYGFHLDDAGFFSKKI